MLVWLFELIGQVEMETVAVLRPGEPGLRPKFCAISYVNPPEFLI